jgi:hypothetical protein
MKLEKQHILDILEMVRSRVSARFRIGLASFATGILLVAVVLSGYLRVPKARASQKINNNQLK